jgi:hypothetical protein
MAQDPIRDYKTAKEQFDEAYTKMTRIRRIITETSQSTPMNLWYQALMSDSRLMWGWSEHRLWMPQIGRVANRLPKVW